MDRDQLPGAALSEGRFTAPRAECPDPQWWHSTDSDSTELEVSLLVGAFVRALQPDCVLETGTAFGQTAEAIGTALAANGHGHLETLEPDAERAEYARLRCRGLPVLVYQRPSLRWLSPQPHPPYGFVWLDSLIHLRAAEFRFYRPWMRVGAIVGFHDCGPQHAVRPEVERLADEGLLRPIYLPTPRGVIFAEVL